MSAHFFLILAFVLVSMVSDAIYMCVYNEIILHFVVNRL